MSGMKRQSLRVWESESHLPAAMGDFLSSRSWMAVLANTTLLFSDTETHTETHRLEVTQESRVIIMHPHDGRRTFDTTVDCSMTTVQRKSPASKHEPLGSLVWALMESLRPRTDENTLSLWRENCFSDSAKVNLGACACVFVSVAFGQCVFSPSYYGKGQTSFEHIWFRPVAKPQNHRLNS